MTMRRRPATGGNEHVDQAIAPVCIVPGEQDRVRISHEADVRQILIFARSCHDKIPLEIIGWNGERGWAVIEFLFMVLLRLPS